MTLEGLILGLVIGTCILAYHAYRGDLDLGDNDD